MAIKKTQTKSSTCKHIDFLRTALLMFFEYRCPQVPTLFARNCLMVYLGP